MNVRVWRKIAKPRYDSLVDIKTGDGFFFHERDVEMHKGWQNYVREGHKKTSAVFIALHYTA